MCNCKDIEIGSYGNQVMLTDLPPHMKIHKAKQGGDPNSICVDTCLKDEILALWALGITTEGCCCGHNKLPAMINVTEKDEPLMEKLGYIYTTNDIGVRSYEPKTLKLITQSKGE